MLLLAKKIIPGLSVSKETRSDLQALEDRIAGENRELCVVGLAALVDPPRDDTASTVATCRAAGIRYIQKFDGVSHGSVLAADLRPNLSDSPWLRAISSKLLEVLPLSSNI